VIIIGADGKTQNVKIAQIHGYLGLQRFGINSGDAVTLLL
jgi:predicted membrane GTPase involved in stress response